jgi:hypothetical protein
MDALNEELDGKFERLLRLGLAPRARLDYYKRALKNTKATINLAEFRPIILDILNKLIANTISDPMIYNKTQQNLLKNLKEAIAVACEEPMDETLVDTIKNIALEGNTLAEAQIVQRQGKNYGKKTVGSVAGRAGKVRKATRKARASSDGMANKLLRKARQRIVNAQKKIATQRQEANKDAQAAQDYQHKQAEAQAAAKV